MSVINVVEKNVDLGGGKKGMKGYSVITYATKDKEIKLRVNNVIWYEGAMGQKPAQPYEHPIKPSKYKLKQKKGKGKYPIKIDKASKNDKVEPWSYVHMGRISEGCIVLGNSREGRGVYRDILSKVRKKSEVFLKVENRDRRRYDKKNEQPLHSPFSDSPYPYEWKD